MNNLFKLQRVIWTLTCLFMISCTSSNITLNGNYLGVSRSLKESKQEGFFIDEYDVVDTSKKLDEIGSFSISEVFVEYQWRSNSDFSKTKTRGYQLILNLHDSIPEGYLFDWVCKIKDGKRLSEFDTSMFVVQNYENQMTDTVRINIYQGDVLYMDSTHQPASQIVLVRKNV